MTNAKQQHTPGPWTYDANLKGDGSFAGTFNVWTDGDKVHAIGEVYQERNARLIAAAPELLEALRSFNDAYSFISENCPQPLTHAVKKARAAIAKAT